MKQMAVLVMLMLAGVAHGQLARQMSGDHSAPKIDWALTDSDGSFIADTSLITDGDLCGVEGTLQKDGTCLTTVEFSMPNPVICTPLSNEKKIGVNWQIMYCTWKPKK